MINDKEDMVRLHDERGKVEAEELIKVDLKNKCIIRLGEKMVCHKNRAYPCTPLCPLCGFDDESVEFYCGPSETVRYDAEVID